MLFEYAVEPELVATWADPRAGRYFIDRFGIGTPRLVSRYPKSWKRLVWKAWEASGKRGAGETGRQRRRMETLIQHLSAAMVERRHPDWDADRSWVENAVDQQVAFHAVLARLNPAGGPRVLVADELDESTPRWAAQHGATVPRRAEAIAKAVGSMLRIATNIVFVDPYFAPDRRRFVNVIAACTGAAGRERVVGPAEIRIFSSDDDERNGTFENFRADCRRYLPHRFPAGQEVTIRRLGEWKGGEKLHNRYILTELGGVSFGVGLDEADDPSAAEAVTDDLNLLASDQYHLRWRQYAGEPPEFDQREDPITITGTQR